MAFDPQTGESFQLNETARLILTHLREGKAPEIIAQEVSKHFGITPERAITDVLEFLVELELMSSAA